MMRYYKEKNRCAAYGNPVNRHHFTLAAANRAIVDILKVTMVYVSRKWN